ncbi:MAG: DUF922 domain-containing protein, partial [Chitinophagaceae bacterium]
YELGKDSWKKKENISDSLLRHEQIHFDIGRICASELQSSINSAIFLKSNYQSRLNALVSACLTKCRQMNDRYDQETNHGGNRDQQLKWEASISADLNKK